MGRPRWMQKVGKKTIRKETAAVREAQQHANRQSRAAHQAMGGEIRYKPGDPRPRNKHGHLIAYLLPDPPIKSRTTARQRRQRAWSLKANNVGRDKRGRFRRL